MGKESTCNEEDTGDLGLILRLGRSPGGGNGNPPQYSSQENPMDRVSLWATVHRVLKRLSVHELPCILSYFLSYVHSTSYNPSGTSCLKIL